MATKNNNYNSNNWTFLTNHFHVLVLLARDPTMRISDMVVEVGITYRGVQKVLSELIDSGVLKANKQGRRNVYSIDLDYRLRHPIESQHTVGQLLEILA